MHRGKSENAYILAVLVAVASAAGHPRIEPVAEALATASSTGEKSTPSSAEALATAPERVRLAAEYTQFVF